MAMMANMLVFNQLPMKNHLTAGGASAPKIVRHIGFLNEGSKFWRNKVREPTH
jgi:hypothetical protein